MIHESELIDTVAIKLNTPDLHHYLKYIIFTFIFNDKLFMAPLKLNLLSRQYCLK